MDNQTLNRVSAALAALDFTAENEAIATLEAQISEYHKAIGRAEDRCTEIARALHKDAGPNGLAVAEALLADAPATDAAAAGPDRATMEAERASLREGIKTLVRRVEDARSEIDRIQRESISQARDAAAPIVHEIIAEVRDVIAKLPPLYAALVAVSGAARGGSAEEGELRKLLAATFGEGGLMPWQRSVPVPNEVIAALRPLADKGAAVGLSRFTHAAPMP